MRSCSPGPPAPSRVRLTTSVSTRLSFQAYNLTRPDYVEIVCGSLDEFASAFAEIDAERRAQLLTAQPSERKATDKELQAEFASLPRADRKIVRAESLKERIEAAANSRAPRQAVGSR